MMKKKISLWLVMSLFTVSVSMGMAQVGDEAGLNGNYKRGTVSGQVDEVAGAGVEVIEKSLLGVGNMLLNLREPGRFRGSAANLSGVKLTLDRRTGNYILMNAGQTLAEVNAETGAYRINPKDAGLVAGTLIETSLAGIGAMIGSLRPGHRTAGHHAGHIDAWEMPPLVMSEESLDALMALWERETGSRQGSLDMLAALHDSVSQFEQGRRRLKAGEEQLERGMRKVDRAMRKLDKMMKKLEDQ